MAEVKGGSQVTTRQGKVRVWWTFSGHIPSPSQEDSVMMELRPRIAKAVRGAPDLAAAASDPSAIAQQVMNEAVPELAKQGIAGALTLNIQLPPGAATAPSQAAEGQDAAAAPEAATPQLTPEQYGSFCAERELYPNHLQQICTKYGVSDPAAIDQQFQQQLPRNPEMAQRYGQAYAQYKAWLQSQQPQ